MDNICKYHSYDTIPAKVFFEIRETGNFQLMRAKNGVKTPELTDIYLKIYDVYFEKSDNKDANRYLQLINLIAAIDFKIKSVKGILEYHWNFEPEIWSDPLIVEFRTQQIEALNPYLDVPIDLSADFDTEIQAALNVSLGIMQNDKSEAEMELDTLRNASAKTVFEFYEQLQSIDEINKQSSSPDLLLPQYVAKEKSALRKIHRNKQAA